MISTESEVTAAKEDARRCRNMRHRYDVGCIPSDSGRREAGEGFRQVSNVVRGEGCLCHNQARRIPAAALRGGRHRPCVLLARAAAAVGEHTDNKVSKYSVEAAAVCLPQSAGDQQIDHADWRGGRARSFLEYLLRSDRTVLSMDRSGRGGAGFGWEAGEHGEHGERRARGETGTDLIQTMRTR